VPTPIESVPGAGQAKAALILTVKLDRRRSGKEEEDPAAGKHKVAVAAILRFKSHGHFNAAELVRSRVPAFFAVQ
jgi:hypothetical protein